MSSGDHFLYSHHLLAEECMDDIGRTYMLSLLGVLRLSAKELT